MSRSRMMRATLAVHTPAQVPQFGVDARDAVGFAGSDVDDGDLVGQGLVGGLPCGSALRRGEPGVEGTAAVQGGSRAAR